MALFRLQSHPVKVGRRTRRIDRAGPFRPARGSRKKGCGGQREQVAWWRPPGPPRAEERRQAGEWQHGGGGRSQSHKAGPGPQPPCKAASSDLLQRWGVGHRSMWWLGGATQLITPTESWKGTLTSSLGGRRRGGWLLKCQHCASFEHSGPRCGTGWPM